MSVKSPEEVRIDLAPSGEDVDRVNRGVGFTVTRYPRASGSDVATGPGLLILLIGVLLVTDALTYRVGSPWREAGVLVQALVVLGLLRLSYRTGYMLFLVLLFFADDISKQQPYGDGSDFASLMATPVAGVAAGNYLAVLVVVWGTFQALQRFRQGARLPRLTSMDAAVLIVPFLYVLVVLHGLSNLQTNLRGALNDLNLPLMMCGFYAVTRLYFVDYTRLGKGDAALGLLWRVIIAAAGAKAVVWSAWYFSGVGVSTDATLRVSFESGRVMLLFALAGGITALVWRRGLCWPNLAVATVIACASAFELFVHADRMQWIFAGATFPIVMMFAPSRERLRFGLLAGGIAVVVVFGLCVARPEAFTTLGKFAATLKFWERGAVMKSESTTARVYEFKNIHAQIREHGNLLLGDGPGSRFGDTYYPYPFNVNKKEHYSSEVERRTRQFENPHNLVASLMLNLGYLGTLVFLGAMGWLQLKTVQAALRLRGSDFEPVAVSLAILVPAMVYAAWSAKNNMLLGVTLGIAANLTQTAVASRRLPESMAYD